VAPPSLLRIGFLTALGIALGTTVAGAQQNGPWDFRNPAASRLQLEQVMARYQSAAQSPAYSQRLRASAAAAADSIRTRLTEGDLRAGDRIRLTVAEQPTLTDTFTVSEGPSLVLPVVGTMDLGGVLRSELEDRIALWVDSVYRGAVVHVVLLTRIAVVGGVARPGFYALPPDALVSDAITFAGGLAPDARLTDIYVERGRSRLWDADSLQSAMRQGRTLASLRLESGDRIIVPLPGSLTRNPTAFLQVLPYLVSLPLTMVSLVQLLK